MIAVPIEIEDRAHIAERNAPNGHNYRCLQMRSYVMNRRHQGAVG
jgi:hypothetical protein